MFKQIKYFLALVLMAIGISSVKAEISFTITVDNASHVSIYTEEWSSEMQDMIPSQYFEAVNNVFQVTVPDNSSIKIKGLYPWNVSSFSYDDGTPVSAYVSSAPNIWSMWLDASYNNKNINITTVDENIGRTNNMNLKIDDAAAAIVILGNGVNSMSFDMKYQPELIDGDNSLIYNPETENKIYIMPKQWDANLYSVTIDGEPVYSTGQWGQEFFFELHDNCVVEIIANAPAGDVLVSFNYSEGSEGCIGKIMVDGEEIEYADQISVKDGSTLTLYQSEGFNITNWCINWGTILDWTGSSNEVAIVGETELYFVAEPRGEINFTVKIDNPEGITMYNSSNNIVNLVSGENSLQAYEGNSTFYWTIAPNYLLESLYLTRENGTPELFTQQSIEAEDGMVLDFSLREKNRDKTAIIWCEGIKDDLECYVMNRFYERIATLKNGYNITNFDEGENPMYIGTVSFEDPKVTILYLDGVAQQPTRDYGYPGWNLTLSDSNIIKIYLSNRPSEYKVTFDIDKPEEIMVTQDIIVPVVDFTNPIKCLEGTQFKIETSAEIEVTIDDMEWDPEEDGSYLIEVSDNHSIKIVTNKSSGIETIDNENSTGIVYTVSGVCLGKIEDLNMLPAGLYIVDGKKVLVK